MIANLRATLIILVLAIFFLIFGSMGCGNNAFHNGKHLYENNCANCHQKDGNGLESLYPPLRNSDYWEEHQEKIPCIIRHGISDTILVNGKEFKMPMLPMPKLTESDIANIINYINKEWYDKDDFYTLKEVKESLGNCE